MEIVNKIYQNQEKISATLSFNTKELEDDDGDLDEYDFGGDSQE